MIMKKRTLILSTIVLLAVMITSFDVNAMEPSDITMSEEQKITNFRNEIKIALASEVYADKCMHGRFFFDYDWTIFDSFDENITLIELEKIWEEIGKIPDDVLKRYNEEIGVTSDDEKNMKKFIEIIIWNFELENLEISNISEITSLTAKEFENYYTFCKEICKNVEKNYAKEMYGIELEDIQTKALYQQERIYKEIEEAKSQNPEKEEILNNMHEGKEIDYYVMKQKVLETQDTELLEFFENTEGKWTEFMYSEIGKISRDCYRIYQNELETVHQKILQNPYYIQNLINEWDGEQPIEEFLATK